MRILLSFIALQLVLCTTVSAKEPLGYISASTINIGDDVQVVAARRLLPPNSIPVDREFISEFDYPTTVKTLVSGWFMHEKGAYWDLKLPPPERSWPPSPKVDPFFFSFHITGTLIPTVFSEENIGYLRAHAPIGARDLFTLNELQLRDIPSYFSGCLTLTLDNPFTERNDVIYVVDLDEKIVNYIRSKTSSPVVEVTHGKPMLQYLDLEDRLAYTEYVLNLYRKAKCVVTARLHAAMPCLAFETPLLMLYAETPGAYDPRFIGLVELTNHTSRQEFLGGEYSYDFDNPPKNPKDYVPIRENLINTVCEWVEKNSK